MDKREEAELEKAVLEIVFNGSGRGWNWNGSGRCWR